MLNHEQLKAIMDKEILTRVDLILLEDHLDYIGRLKNEYGMTMPIDVDSTLTSDIETIVERLQSEIKNRFGIMLDSNKNT